MRGRRAGVACVGGAARTLAHTPDAAGGASALSAPRTECCQRTALSDIAGVREESLSYIILKQCIFGRIVFVSC